MLSSIKDTLGVARTMAPLLTKAARSGQLFSPACELTPPNDDVVCRYDVQVPVEDGFYLTANVFYSRAAEAAGKRVPVIMSAHPYDNNKLPARGRTPLGGAPIQYRLLPQAGRPSFSTITSWEAPDPNFWVGAGYAVVNLNLPGYGTSQGPPTILSRHQAKCFYEAIEWIARQPYCNGRVGLSGVSFLAISQYHVATCEHYGGPPPSLKCISPWEGMSNLYREVACRGGVEDIGFLPFWFNMDVKSALGERTADFLKYNEVTPADGLAKHPLYDQYWEQMAAPLEQIKLPMLVCAAFGDHGMHTSGSFAAFTRAKSAHKWLYTHRDGKWDVYYSDAVKQLTREFMDCFLKDDTSSGFLDRAPVRLEVRSSRDVIREVRQEQTWPLEPTQYRSLFLDTESSSLRESSLAKPQAAHHGGHGGRTVFTYRFAQDTELTGYMKLRLWVEARGAKAGDPAPDDLIVFAAVNKLDRNGRSVRFRGPLGCAEDMVARGCARAARRELDTKASTEWLPVFSGTSHQPLKPGEIVPLDIALEPSCTFFEAGESIELIVSADEIVRIPPFRKDVSPNRGVHVFHAGGSYDSHLLIPVINPPA